MRTYYFAQVVDPDPMSPTHGLRIVIEVNATGEPIDTHRQAIKVERWYEVKAKNKKLARLALRKGERTAITAKH